jgi:hypothetical protein
LAHASIAFSVFARSAAKARLARLEKFADRIAADVGDHLAGLV